MNDILDENVFQYKILFHYQGWKWVGGAEAV
jgi:hypothetical protein